MEKKIDAVKKEYTDAINRKKYFQDKLLKLEETKEVKDYLMIKEYLDYTDIVLKKIEDDIKIEEMKECIHMFVCSNPESLLGNENVYHCLRCGLTNLYKEKIIDDELSYVESKMGEIYDETALQGLKLKIETSEIDLFKRKLNELEKENPYATDISKGFELEYFYRNQMNEQKEKVLKK